MTTSEGQAISPKLLEILRCPAGWGRIEQRGARLVCRSCGLAFPIRDGIPVMLLEEAELPGGVGSLAEIRCSGEPATGQEGS